MTGKSHLPDCSSLEGWGIITKVQCMYPFRFDAYSRSYQIVLTMTYVHLRWTSYKFILGRYQQDQKFEKGYILDDRITISVNNLIHFIATDVAILETIHAGKHT